MELNKDLIEALQADLNKIVQQVKKQEEMGQSHEAQKVKKQEEMEESDDMPELVDGSKSNGGVPIAEVEDDDIVEEDVNNVSTEGVTDHEYANFSDEQCKQLRQCHICNKYYKLDMMGTENHKDKDDKGKDNFDEICWHCYYWINYAPDVRNKVDGKNGHYIVDYIQKCKDIHELDKCSRNTNSGGCLLCEFNMGLPIVDIKNYNKLTNTVPDKANDNISDDSFDPNNMTLTI